MKVLFSVETGSILLSGLIGLLGLMATESTPLADDRPDKSDLFYSIQLDFSLNVLRALGESSPGENLVFSPLALSNSMATLLRGSSGGARAELEQVFRLPAESLHDYEAHQNAVITAIHKNQYDCRVSYVSVFEYPQAVPPSGDYAERIHAAYDTSFLATANKPLPVKTPLTNATGMPYLEFSLHSTLKFKGIWGDTFSPHATTNLPFHRMDGTEILRPFMRKNDHYMYFEDDSVQALELGYMNPAYKLLLLLPRNRKGITGLVKHLDADKIREITDQLRYKEGKIKIPKFVMEGTYDLSSVIREMGVTEAFRPDSVHFAHIWGQPSYLEKIESKTVLEVHEKGTEAISEVVVLGGVLDGVLGPGEKPPPPFHFVADHPFLFLLMNDSDDAPLYLGVVYEP